MFDRIRALAESSGYDFREFANPDDPLDYLFEEWVPYYRTKRAIAEVVAPRSILEIGVRYGYSARAFLDGAPGARYVGIDNDSHSFGGHVGAFEWARRITEGRDAEFLIADTQRMDALPGGPYDLVHVDGQQDGDGTWHDLEIALPSARWILVDGVFWSRENLLASSYFLQKYRDRIEGAVVIPGYAGDLLIRTRTGARAVGSEVTHETLRDEYDAAYFLLDCGGYDAFKQHRGRRLVDPRLVTLFELAAPGPGMDVLDVGCGRGELSYACFAAGANVIGVDYAADAVALAQQTYAEAIGERLAFVESDILEFTTERRFDCIVAADFVEHLSPDALDRAFAVLSKLLKPGGRLLVHTWPNRIAYERRHRAQRALARAAGTWLPPSPRSHYEDRMHLNEQTPARLRRALSRAFPAAVVWVGDAESPLGGGSQSLGRTELGRYESIYAVAARQPIDAQEIEQRLLQRELDPLHAAAVHIELAEPIGRLIAGETRSIGVTLRNDSPAWLGSRPPFPVHVSYRWLRDRAVVVGDGLRTTLQPGLAPGTMRTMDVALLAPPAPGRYELLLTLVQEQRFWFDTVAPGAACRIDVEVAAQAT